MNRGADPSDGLRFQSTVCVGCGAEFPGKSADDIDWCATCRPLMRRRIKRGRHLIAALITLPFAIWILTLERGGTLSQTVWVLPLSGAYYLGYRIGGEVMKTVVRLGGTGSGR